MEKVLGDGKVEMDQSTAETKLLEWCRKTTFGYFFSTSI